MAASPASRAVSVRDPLSIFRFLYHRSSIRFGAALAIAIGMRFVIPLVAAPWPVAAWLGLLFLATVLLAARRRPLAWLTAYLFAADVWYLLWLGAADTAIPLQVDYPVVLDRILGLGELPTVRLQDWFHRQGAIGAHDIALVLVYGTFFFAQQATLFALWLLRPRLLGRYAIAFLAMSYLALVGFFLVPTAPPWMAAELGAAPDVLRVSHEIFRAAIGSTFDEGYATANLNEVAAMPSVHLGATYVLAIAWTRANPRFRWPGIAYCVAMGVALVYLGEHYLVDVLAGAAIGYAGWRVSDLAYARVPWLARSGDATEEATAAPVTEEPARAA